MKALIVPAVIATIYLILGVIIFISNKRKARELAIKEVIEIGDIVWFENLPWEVVNFDLYTKDPVLYRAGRLERCPKIEEVMLIKKGK